MTQEAIQEVDMDVFSRRIGPYFSWLESKIESGWQQSDHVQKDILKETKYLATTMRARFILGVTKPDFVKEVERALELFDIAMEAFPGESDEIESKVKHFTKGITEELGADFMPVQDKEQISEESVEIIEPIIEVKPVKVKSEIKSVKVKSEANLKSKSQKPSKSKKPSSKKKTKVKPKKLNIKTEEVAEVAVPENVISESVKPVEEKTEKSVQPVQDSEKPKSDKPKTPKRRFCIIKWVKEFIFGEDLK